MGASVARVVVIGNDSARFDGFTDLGVVDFGGPMAIEPSLKLVRLRASHLGEACRTRQCGRAAHRNASTLPLVYTPCSLASVRLMPAAAVRTAGPSDSRSRDNGTLTEMAPTAWRPWSKMGAATH